MEGDQILKRIFMRKIILLFSLGASLFAQDPKLIIEDKTPDSQEGKTDLLIIEENNQETAKKELEENLSLKNEQPQNPIENQSDSKKTNPQDSIQEPSINQEQNQIPIEEKQKEAIEKTTEESKESQIQKDAIQNDEQENEIQKNIKEREREESIREAQEAQQAKERRMKADEAKIEEEKERKLKEEGQTTKPPIISEPDSPAIKQPNPNANPASPDFFDLNKNQSRESLRSIGPKELRAKIEQCEEKEDKNACFDVGMIYYQGRSIYGQQLRHALYFFDRSCDEKNGFGCYEAGIIGANFKQYQYALIFLEKSCQSGDLRGCKNLGVLYYNGWGAPKNMHLAAELFNFGCKSGDQSSCQKFYLALGDAYKEARNFIGAKKNYQKGCELGDEQSCKEMEVMDLLQKELYRQNVIQNNAKRRP